MTYHYKECGLDYVYLENGYTEHETPYGKGVSFDDVDAMNNGIAKIIIQHKSHLQGQDVKFLRSVINMSQTRFGHMIGVSRASIASVEAEPLKDVSKPMDKLARIFALEYIDDQKVRALIDRLGDIDDAQDNEEISKMMCVHYNEPDWELCAA